MLSTILLLLAMALILTVILWAGTIWFQGWLYNEPAGELYCAPPPSASASRCSSPFG